MFNRTVFVVVMPRTSATYNSMIVCDAPSARNTKSILLSFDYSENTTYFFVGIND